MSTGAPAEQMKRNPAEGGGNMQGGMNPVDRDRVPSFQGKSGQPDNQSTNRGKGRT